MAVFGLYQDIVPIPHGHLDGFDLEDAPPRRSVLPTLLPGRCPPSDQPGSGPYAVDATERRHPLQSRSATVTNPIWRETACRPTAIRASTPFRNTDYILAPYADADRRKRFRHYTFSDGDRRNLSNPWAVAVRQPSEPSNSDQGDDDSLHRAEADTGQATLKAVDTLAQQMPPRDAVCTTAVSQPRHNRPKRPSIVTAPIRWFSRTLSDAVSPLTTTAKERLQSLEALGITGNPVELPRKPSIFSAPFRWFRFHSEAISPRTTVPEDQELTSTEIVPAATSEEDPSKRADSGPGGGEGQGQRQNDSVTSSLYCPDEELYSRQPSTASTVTTTQRTSPRPTVDTRSAQGNESAIAVPHEDDLISPKSGPREQSGSSSGQLTTFTSARALQQPHTTGQGHSSAETAGAPTSTVPRGKKSSLRSPHTPKKNIRVRTPVEGEHQLVKVPIEKTHYGEFARESRGDRERLGSIEDETMFNRARALIVLETEAKELNRLCGLPEEDRLDVDQNELHARTSGVTKTIGGVKLKKRAQLRVARQEAQTPDEISRSQSHNMAALARNLDDKDLAASLRKA